MARDPSVSRTEARELLGDLVVQSTELVERRGDPERWLRLASAAARHIDHDDEMLASLAATLDDATLLDQLAMGERLVNSPAWERACVYRSGLEDLRTLLGDRDALDTSRIELAMIRHGNTRYAPVPIPDGTPREHWWWFEAQPASERSLRMNARMRELLTIPTDMIPGGFRSYVAVAHLDTSHELVLETVLDRDPSRRPVDLAGIVLACVRYLASEMRRRRSQPRRLVVEQRRLSATIRWLRAGADVDLYADVDAAMLALNAP